jgi:transcriptional regulator
MYMMIGMPERSTTVDLLQGTLATLILKSLSWGPLHGYGIARWIEQVTEDELLVEEGSLYPALHRLQARELVSSQWTISDTNRRVRCYTLTEQGKQQLRAELSRWDRFSVAVSRALQARRPSKTL